MGAFEKFAPDQFPFRDYFRTLKTSFSLFFLQQKDNNGIYISEGYAAKIEYPLNVNSIERAGEKISTIYKNFIEGNDCKVYSCVIPDKNYFLASNNQMLAIDYDRLVEIFNNTTPFAQYINITDTLTIDDYYKTDTHWRQEKIIQTARRITEAMGSSEYLTSDYCIKEADIDFSGVYRGQSALPLKSEKIYYLTNSVINECRVNNKETGEIIGVYDLNKLYSRDPYDVFLSGACALMTIENPNAKRDRELIVFRDSFASSIMPLMCEAYSKITLIDTRYFKSELLGNYVSFKSCDVLFIYGSSLLNNSIMLK